jgi:hypothetical protein
LGKGFFKFFFKEQYKEEGNKVKRNQKGKCVRKKEKKRQKGSAGMKMKMLPIFISSKAWMKQNLK